MCTDISTNPSILSLLHSSFALSLCYGFPSFLFPSPLLSFFRGDHKLNRIYGSSPVHLSLLSLKFVRSAVTIHDLLISIAFPSSLPFSFAYHLKHVGCTTSTLFTRHARAQVQSLFSLPWCSTFISMVKAEASLWSFSTGPRDEWDSLKNTCMKTARSGSSLQRYSNTHKST